MDFVVFQLLSHFQLCDPMDCSTPGFPVHHYLIELAQTHVHWVGHTIQPSHPLLSPSPPALSLSQHQSLFQRVGLLHQVIKDWSFSFSISRSRTGVSASASVLPMNIQDWFPLGLTGLIFFLSKGFSRVLSRTAVQKHQFFGSQPSLWSNSYIRTWLLEKVRLWLQGRLLAK